MPILVRQRSLARQCIRPAKRIRRQDLNSLLDASGRGWELYGAAGINKSGEIAAYDRFGGRISAAVLTPIVPEPSTAAAAALAAVALRGLRRVCIQRSAVGASVTTDG